MTMTAAERAVDAAKEFGFTGSAANDRELEAIIQSAIQAATAAEREARPDETIIEHRLRTDPEYCQLFIKEASKLAVEAEREACAGIVQAEADSWSGRILSTWKMLTKLAERIRARGGSGA